MQDPINALFKFKNTHTGYEGFVFEEDLDKNNNTIRIKQGDNETILSYNLSNIDDNTETFSLGEFSFLKYSLATTNETLNNFEENNKVETKTTTETTTETVA